MPRWAILIDLRKCNGCRCCAVNCSQVNELSLDAPWRQVPEIEVRIDSALRRLFLPLSCMHCAHPPCQQVCPTSATFQRPDGIVDIDPDRCMGCGYCVVACPYLARTVVPHQAPWAADGLGPGDGRSIGGILQSYQPGICTKCNLCWPRLDEGLRQGLKPGVDAAASPVCAVTCLAHAIHFGDRDDPDSVISRLLQEEKTWRVHEGLETEPSMYYILG